MAADLGWTRRGALEERGGGAGASEGTHIRLRHYLADAMVTVALTLVPATDEPSLHRVSEALRAPARPLFLGRKCCVPSGPVWLAETVASSLREALERAPRAPGLRAGDPSRSDPGALQAVWPRDEGGDESHTRLWARVEDRNLENSVHVGRRIYVEGLVDPPGSVTTATSVVNESSPEEP
jgi:CRISPR system Cascade subunit CasD